MPLIVNYPHESTQVALIQAVIPTATLGDLQIAVDELTALSRKTGGIAQAIFSDDLFGAAMQRSDELSEREIALNHQISLLREEVGDLAINKDRFTPEQIAERLDRLQKKIFSCGAPSTPYLAQQLSELEKQWAHIYFLFEFPIAEELNPNSFQSNLLSRLTHQIEVSIDSKKAESLQKMLMHLHFQCQLAEEIFCGERKATALPTAIRLDVKQRLFRRFPDFRIEQLDPKETAAALMDSLSEQMMAIEI